MKIRMEQGIPSGAVFKVKICSSEKQLDEITKDELIEFVRFGNAVASLCVEKEGQFRQCRIYYK